MLCKTARSCQWVGLGGYNIRPLIQMGDTAKAFDDGSTGYYIWYELVNTSYTDNTEQIVSNFPVKPGDQVYCEITTYSSGNGITNVNFYLNDTTIGKITSCVKSITTNSAINSSAEWISEIPTMYDLAGNKLKSYYPLTTCVSTGGNYVRFNYAKFGTGARTKSTDSANWNVITNNNNLSKVTMITDDYTSTVAEPGDLSTSKIGSFDINWVSYGK